VSLIKGRAILPPQQRQLAASKAPRQDVQLYVSLQFFQIDMKGRFLICVSVERRVKAGREPGVLLANACGSQFITAPGFCRGGHGNRCSG
jgi:hypothetical protein